MATHQYDANTTADQLVNDYADLIKGKTILTTGVTPGSLGAAFVHAIAKAQPKLLINTGRSPDKLRSLAEELQPLGVATKSLELDLSSLEDVRRAADQVNSWDDVPQIDVVVANAGLMATPWKTTKDGLESQFGVNHVAHFLFVNLIMNKILASQAPRVVMITSDGHRLNPMRWADYNFDDGKTYNKWHAYGQSKTANMLMALSLAEKLNNKGLLSFSVHPGTVEGTALGTHLDMEQDYPALQAADKALGNPEGWATSFTFRSQQQGVATHVYASFAPALKDNNGSYLLDCRVGDPLKDTIKPWATSSIEAERLWKLSEKLVGQEFKY